jgi:hypothetical protein
MAFSSLCQSDPLLDFIRATYGAIPLRVPDQRFQPLALFTVQDRRARYLGTLSDLALHADWSVPRSSDSEVAQISGNTSGQIAWSAAGKLLGPFVSGMLGIEATGADASLKGASSETEGVRVSIGPTRRTMVNPFAIAKSVGRKTHRLPRSIHDDLGKWLAPAFYVVDSVLTARSLTLELIGSNAKDAAAHLEAMLVGEVKASQMLRANSKLTVKGNNRTPFAFTCIRVELDADGFIDTFGLEDSAPRLQATPVGSLAGVQHANLGESHELLAFDD